LQGQEEREGDVGFLEPGRAFQLIHFHGLYFRRILRRREEKKGSIREENSNLSTIQEESRLFQANPEEKGPEI